MIKPKYKLGQKLYILSSKKTDGRYNQGTIVGVSLDNSYSFGYFSYKQFLDSFKYIDYKVAYQDCSTERFCVDIVPERCLSKTIPGEVTAD